MGRGFDRGVEGSSERKFEFEREGNLGNSDQRVLM